jgi:hypothetical protein
MNPMEISNINEKIDRIAMALGAARAAGLRTAIMQARDIIVIKCDYIQWEVDLCKDDAATKLSSILYSIYAITPSQVALTSDLKTITISQ